MCGPYEGWPHSVTAGALPPGSSKVVRGQSGAGDGTCGVTRQLRRLLGRDAERFGIGPAVVPGHDLTEAAGPVRHGALADLAAVTGSRVTVTGKRREGGLLICLYDASPARVIVP